MLTHSSLPSSKNPLAPLGFPSQEEGQGGGDAQPSPPDQRHDQAVGDDSGLQGLQQQTDQQHLHDPAHPQGAAWVLPDHQEANRPQEGQGTFVVLGPWYVVAVFGHPADERESSKQVWRVHFFIYGYEWNSANTI